MNRAIVDPIADAVLYEGYILYPYRPSTKNRQRWTFGGLYPEAFCRARSGESSGLQAECLVAGTAGTRIEAVVRFLHLTARIVGEVSPPLTAWPEDAEPQSRPVADLRVSDRIYQTWQEAEEREVVLGEMTLGELWSRPRTAPFASPGGRRAEPVLDAAGAVVGVLIREQQPIAGIVELEVEASVGLFRLTLRVANRTPLDAAAAGTRDEVSLRALVSTHAILGVAGGEFVSLTDPPGRWREAAAACRNIGVWPVLVGEAGRKDTMLASPIILPDYPQVAPESAGDYFDGTEIDEMLALRIMTLTDAEKGEMAAVDGKARALLERVEGMTREQLLGLHGAVRGLRPVAGGDDHE
jgi:hydrogenase maturation protease